MACNCGGRKKPLSPSSNKPAGTEYVLRTSKGTQVYYSKLEAEAAKKRLGGGMIVTRPQK